MDRVGVAFKDAHTKTAAHFPKPQRAVRAPGNGIATVGSRGYGGHHVRVAAVHAQTAPRGNPPKSEGAIRACGQDGIRLVRSTVSPAAAERVGRDETCGGDLRVVANEGS